MTALRADAASWLAVCPLHSVPREQGVAALFGDRQLAVFRTYDDALFATDNRDPYSGAYVLARGIVGTRGEAPTIASPLHKQVFDLRTGICLDDPETAVRNYPVRVRDGVVEVCVTDEVP